MKPWARQRNESEEAHAAYLRYRDMKPPRSLERLNLSDTSAIPKIATLKRWSTRHAWVERCRVWDNHLQDRRDAAAARYSAAWEVRRLKAVEKSWALGDVLEERAEKMLAMPITVQKTSKDGKTINVHPGKWTYASIALMIRTVAELRSVALAAAIRPLGEYRRPELEKMQEARDKFIGLNYGPTAEDEG